MKSSLKFLLTFVFITFIFNILCISGVQASEIIAENAISFMKDNNILEDDEYFYMFGKMLNGNDDYDIDSFKYNISIEESNINIDVTLNDKKSGSIERTTTLTLEDGLIKYVNNNEVDSLESRIDTVILSQLIYSIGGARGYEKDILFDWMNQIDLKKVNADAGIDLAYEVVKYEIEQEGRTYEYEVSVPKSYTIDVNKVTEEIPEKDTVEIKEVEPGISSVSMMIYAENHSGEMCNVYRRDKNSQFELVGTVSCNNGQFTDIKLKDETVYYYTAAIENKVMCSPETEVTTLKSPVTGAFIPVIGFLVLVTLGAALYKAYKDNKLFKKI